jgi:PAS domain S-box-containing protein
MSFSDKDQALRFSCGNISDCIAQRDNYEAIFNSMTDGLAIVGADQKVKMCNTAFCAITGLSREAVIGKTLSQLCCRNQACGLNQAILKTVASGNPVKDDAMDILRRDGTKIPAVFSTSILHNKQGAPTGIVVLFRDLSVVEELQKKLLERDHFHSLTGRSYRMQEVYELIEAVAPTDATVLIAGESGTGKELVANAVHYNSSRASGPFIKVSCAALSETILESELFGHVKGAFTGAYRDRIGRFEQAHGGSLFLDEIGEIGPAVQVKLLRVLQEREIERVGDTKTRQVDVRIIAATNKNLQQLVQEHRFREDLYYRLKVVTIDMPPLRSRMQDIPLLVEHFIKKLNAKYKKAITALSPAGLNLLMEYAWAGNVRELENALEHAFVKARTAVLLPVDFPHELRQAGAVQKNQGARSGEIDREYLVEMLKRSGGNQTKAAQAMGIDRTTLWRHLKKYNVEMQRS